MAKTMSIVNLVLGLAIMLFMVLSILRGEESAKSGYILVPMGVGLYCIISGIIGLLKKAPQTPAEQPAK